MAEAAIKIKLTGELGWRADINFQRLHCEEHYGLAMAFRPVDYEWPGDWEGRLILALTLISDVTGHKSDNLEAIIRSLPEHLNQAGYFGKIYENGIVDEQQLSSHGWVLRGLAEYYKRHRGDASIKNIVNGIIDHLILPLLGKYRCYPVGLEFRRSDGGAIGLAADRCCGDWRLSTDVCCAFILMDGLVQAAELFNRADCYPLIEEMINRLQDIDLSGIKAQTHASLTAVRGLLRYYEIKKISRVLDLAKKIYRQYREDGMTEHFANYNWFRRPEWTEPCAIVDAYMVANDLWRLTGQSQYLRDAHCIWHSGVERAQRPNGGFGGDSCPRSEDAILQVKFYEAYWCCTMRGAEGLFRRAFDMASYLNGEVTVAIPAAGEISFGDGLSITLDSDYPYNGDCRIIINDVVQPLNKIRYFLPFETASATAMLNGESVCGKVEDGFFIISGVFVAGSVIDIHSGFVAEKRNAVSNDIFGWWHGPLMLGWPVGYTPSEPLSYHKKGIYKDADGVVMRPVNDFAFFAGLPSENDEFINCKDAMEQTTLCVLTK